jgi:hypothetical protein
VVSKPCLELISPRIQTDFVEEADKGALAFTSSIASPCRLSTCILTLLDLNNDPPSLDQLSKHRHRLRKLWHETRDSSYKLAVNWVTKMIGRITLRKINIGKQW